MFSIIKLMYECLFQFSAKNYFANKIARNRHKRALQADFCILKSYIKTYTVFCRMVISVQ